MARITQECAARIKDSADIVELVGRYVQLRRAGNSWKACCPFHSEKTPSFHVNPARQSFHCFGCGVGGDALKFIMMFENLDYPTALRRLADMNGIPVIEEAENPEMARLRRLRGRIVEVNQLAAEYFHRKLCRDRAAQHVRDYLRKREFNIDIAKTWQLGWAPEDSSELLRLAASRGMDTRLLTDAYLLAQGRRGNYTVFRNRLMFPIHNVRGEVVGFSGRVMQEEQDPRKYLNTAETPAFRKSELLFGLHKATAAMGKAGMTAVVCEGQLDVIACHEKADIRNAVAGLGTAFTDEHARLLRKYAGKAILCYDGDNAGIKASEKTFRKLAAAGLEVYHASLPAGEDPDSLIRTRGAQALKDAIAQARPYLEVRVGQELSLIRGDANARAALIPRMADLAAEITDRNRRDVAVADLATRLNTGLEALRESVEAIIRSKKEAPPANLYDAPAAPEMDVYGEEDTYPPSPAEEHGTPPARIIPISLHAVIHDLLLLASSHAEAQQMLLDRIEELQEPIRLLSGGVVLQRFLETLPTPGDETAWQQFVQSLPPEQAAALKNLPENRHSPDNIAATVEQTCAVAAIAALKAQVDRLRSRIAHMEPMEAAQIIQEVSELQRLINQAEKEN
ncbi:MAG: DNA primase [Akkermansia sp.]|nr:DNA primase [Akkermansia sp.]